MEITFESLRELAERHVLPIGLDLLLGAIVFVLGRWAARWLIRGVTRLMETSQIDTSLRKFLADLLYAILLAAVVIMSLDTMGIHTTAVVAVLGAAGLAVGLALHGSLSNFAAGVMIIVLRHYKVGDLVVIGKHVGKVDSIKVFHTILVTADHREVTIPNGQIISQPIENMTVLGMRRVDIQVTVAHGADLRDLKRDLEQTIATDVRIALSPAPAIELYEVGADVLKLNVRPWTQCESYQAVAADTIERIRDRLDDRDYKFTVAMQPT